MGARTSVVSMRWAVGVSLLAVFALASMLLARNDFYHDFTRGQRRSLAPQTRQILAGIDGSVRLTAFYDSLPEERALFRELVNRFREVQPRLTLRMVDLDREPKLAEDYSVSANRTVIVEYGELKVRTVDPREAELAGAILRATSGRPPRVYFVAGHGEASLEDETRGGISEIGKLLAEQNFDLRILQTKVTRRIPTDADILVLASPEGSFSAQEMAQLTEYILDGGRVAALLEPAGSASADSLVGRFGIVADPGFVVDATDERRNLLGEGNYRFALALGGLQGHPITAGFNLPVVFPLARGFHLEQPLPPGIEAQRLLETGRTSWMEQDLRTMGEGRPLFQDGVDVPGPVGLAYAAEVTLRDFQIDAAARGTLTSLALRMGGAADFRDSVVADTLSAGETPVLRAARERARLVVFGDVDFVNNANLRVQGNSAMFLASMHWLAEQENRIALPADRDLSDPLVLTQRQRALLRWVALFLLPVGMLVAAVGVSWRRRRWV